MKRFITTLVILSMSVLTASAAEKNTNIVLLTGDLGKLGCEILLDLMENKGYKLKDNYNDCGQMIFSNSQKTFQGGSGCGCSAVILNSYVIQKMKEGKYKKVLFAATGALLSTLSSQQGNTIPGICHAVELRRKD